MREPDKHQHFPSEIQFSFGSGDNVAGDKVTNLIVTDISEPKLKVLLEKCIEHFDSGDFDKLKYAFEMCELATTGYNNILKIFKVYFNIDCLDNTEKLQTLFDLANHSNEFGNYYKDYLYDSIIKICIADDNREFAFEYLSKREILDSVNFETSFPKTFTSYLASLAPVSALETYEKSLLITSTEVCCGLINGFIRFNMVEKAISFWESKRKIQSNEKFDEILFCLNGIQLLNRKLLKVHYFNLDKEVKKELDNYIEEAISRLSVTDPYKVKNILTVSLEILDYIFYENRILAQSCYSLTQTMNEFKNQNSLLDYLLNENFSKLDKSKYNIMFARHNSVFKESELTRIFQNDAICDKDLAFIIAYATKKQLSTFLSNPNFQIKVDDSDKFFIPLQISLLQLKSYDNARDRANELANIVDFCKALSSFEIKSVNPTLFIDLHKIIENDDYPIGMYYLKEFGEQVLKLNNFWVSEAHEIFFNLLLKLEQKKSLLQLLESLSNTEHSESSL